MKVAEDFVAVWIKNIGVTWVDGEPRPGANLSSSRSSAAFLELQLSPYEYYGTALEQNTPRSHY